MTDGQQMCECAYCHKVGTVYVRAAIDGTGHVDGFVCLGGMLLPSGRVRALCSGCVQKATAAFARVSRVACEGPRGAAKERRRMIYVATVFALLALACVGPAWCSSLSICVAYGVGLAIGYYARRTP